MCDTTIDGKPPGPHIGTMTARWRGFARGRRTRGCSRRRFSGATALLGLAVVSLGCESGDSGPQMEGGQTGDEYDQLYRSLTGDTERRDIEGPAAGSASEELADFAWSFYVHAGDRTENFVYSPYSITTAASMLYAGAAGNTQAEMTEVFRFGPEGDEFHQARNDLMQYLAARNVEATEDRNAQSLLVTNDFWMAERLPPEDAFLNTLSTYYGAPVHVFEVGSDALRREINAKISEDTKSLIPELLPEDSIREDTVFVLTNALYFKARWLWEFNADLTEPADFTGVDGETGQVQMMHVRDYEWGYASVDGVEVVSMAYSGRELEFVAMMPPEGEFESFSAGLDAASVAGLTSDLPSTNLELGFPRLEIETEVPLTDELEAAGMTDAFDEAAADFSSLSLKHTWLNAAYHKTKIVVNEEGTEAAAATAFVGVDESAPPEPIAVTFDRPFVYFIRDIETGAVLFVGHFVEP